VEEAHGHITSHRIGAVRRLEAVEALIEAVRAGESWGAAEQSIVGRFCT